MDPQLPRGQYWCERRLGKCNLASLQRTALTYRQMQEARALKRTLVLSPLFRSYSISDAGTEIHCNGCTLHYFNQPGYWLNRTKCTVSRAGCRSGAPSSLGVTIAMACHTGDCELKATNKGPPLSVKKNLEILFLTQIPTEGWLHQVLVNICRYSKTDTTFVHLVFFGHNEVRTFTAYNLDLE